MATFNFEEFVREGEEIFNSPAHKRFIEAHERGEPRLNPKDTRTLDEICEQGFVQLKRDEPELTTTLKT